MFDELKAFFYHFFSSKGPNVLVDFYISRPRRSLAKTRQFCEGNFPKVSYNFILLPFIWTYFELKEDSLFSFSVQCNQSNNRPIWLHCQNLLEKVFFTCCITEPNSQNESGFFQWFYQRGYFLLFLHFQIICTRSEQKRSFQGLPETCQSNVKDLSFSSCLRVQNKAFRRRWYLFPS